MDLSLSEILKYQGARRLLRMPEGKERDPEEVAGEFEVLPGLTRLLVVVTNLWDRVAGADRDREAFCTATEDIFRNVDFSNVARAMAAEARSSMSDGEERVDWGCQSLALSAGMGHIDARILRWKVWFGEVDAAGRKWTYDEVRAGLDFFNAVGAHDAPGRVDWWLKQLDLEDPRRRAEAVRALCAVVQAHAVDPGAMNEWYLQNKCAKRLAELLAT